MGVLLLLTIFTIVLILGFGFNGWSLSALILAFTAGLAFLMVATDVEGIKQSWNERRCDLDILITSFLYKRDDDPRSSGEFMTDNFSFCMHDTFGKIIQVLLTPVYMALGKQITAAMTLVESMNILRNLGSSLMSSFMKIFYPVVDRFFKTGLAVSQNFQRFYSAMRRIGGIAVASLYSGMSMVLFMENLVYFVIKVVLIIMGIIASLFLLLFWGLIPFLFILITTVAVLNEAGISTGDFGSVFCFDPATPIRLKDGTVKTIDQISIGDILEDDGEVEGVLRCAVTNEQIYSVNGILVSGSHLIWSEEEGEWIHVKDHWKAQPTAKRPNYLVCLQTSTRQIVLRDFYSHPHLFRDWEELPSDMPEADSFWNYLVTKILEQKSVPHVPKNAALCGPRCLVTLSTGEKVPISMISIGSTVYSEKGFTKVLAVYEGVSMLSSRSSLSDGVWIQEKAGWGHLKEAKGEEQRGFHLITQSGSFWVESDQYSGFIRDFTDVGIQNLDLTYSFTRALLKKSLSKEELCAQDFLSRAYLSCLQPIF